MDLTHDLFFTAAYLRERAQFDRRAARQLRSCLVHDLRTQQAVRRDLQGERGTGADQAGLLQDVERAEQATRASGRSTTAFSPWLVPAGSARGGPGPSSPGLHPLASYLAPDSCSHYRTATKILKQLLRRRRAARPSAKPSE